LLADLLQCAFKLAELELPPESRICKVRDSANELLCSKYSDTIKAFNEQSVHIRTLAKSSRRYSPIISPIPREFGEKFAAVTSSPASSRYASPQSVYTEPEEGTSSCSMHASPSSSAHSPEMRQRSKEPTPSPALGDACPRVEIDFGHEEADKMTESEKNEQPFASIFGFSGNGSGNCIRITGLPDSDEEQE